jgi:3-hydroxyacyl-[acyl-carrier protein] dehydratase/trans-2-decenoyl-[acyl-carrier protein] isomerase
MDIFYPDVVPKFPKKNSYAFPEILAFANREFGDDLPPLPLPPWLMLHRVVTMSESGGKFDLGAAVAEYDVRPTDSYFASHFKGNPLMPGVLGVDAVQQLAGFMLVWSGARGDGMAFGVDGVKFRGKVTPNSGTIRIGIEVKQIKLAKISTIRASGWVEADGKAIYTIDEATVGVVARKAA